MRESLRNSGMDIIGDVPWGIHFCQLYQTKEDLVDILVSYFKTGLENNEFWIWVTSRTLEVEDAKKFLRIAISDLDIYLRKGQIAIIPYTSWCLKKDIFDSESVLNEWGEKLNHALDSGYDGLRFGGNIFRMDNEDWTSLVEYVKLIDKVLGKYQTIDLFTYSLKKCSATERQKNITGCKCKDLANIHNEHRVKLKLEKHLSPARKMENLELAEVIDAQAIQSLMDEFYKLARIPIGIIDLKGNILVGVGWQDICTKFHRIHPES